MDWDMPMKRSARRRLRGSAIVAILVAIAGSAIAVERKPPAPERKPPPDRTAAAEAHYELGVFYHERMFADLDQAIAEYEQAIKLKGDLAHAHYYLGLSYHTKAKLGVDEKALYRKALKEYKLYLKYLPKGELAEKARQNIKAVESRLR
jgi:tetratricopeptide (TPR) repeat protein